MINLEKALRLSNLNNLLALIKNYVDGKLSTLSTYLQDIFEDIDASITSNTSYGRVHVSTTNWSSSSANEGYLENVITVAECPFDTPIWGITGSDDISLPTISEQLAFNSVEYLYVDGLNLIFYTTSEEPPGDFYVNVQGVSLI